MILMRNELSLKKIISRSNKTWSLVDEWIPKKKSLTRPEEAESNQIFLMNVVPILADGGFNVSTYKPKVKPIFHEMSNDVLLGVSATVAVFSNSRGNVFQALSFAYARSLEYSEYFQRLTFLSKWQLFRHPNVREIAGKDMVTSAIETLADGEVDLFTLRGIATALECDISIHIVELIQSFTISNCNQSSKEGNFKMGLVFDVDGKFIIYSKRSLPTTNLERIGSRNMD